MLLSLRISWMRTDRYNGDILQAASNSPTKPFTVMTRFEPGSPPR